MTDPIVGADRVLDPGLQGRYAGVATRFGAFVLDVLIVSTSFSLGGLVVEYVVSAMIGKDFDVGDLPAVSTAFLVGWWFLYCAYSLSVAGRTLGMAALGLRVVRSDGSQLDVGHAVLRVVAFPLSFVLFGFGFLLILIRRDRRALHDLIGRACVVYAWDARAARLRFLSRT
jgi:uncharacterized RDD family membrane protein YckC